MDNLLAMVNPRPNLVIHRAPKRARRSFLIVEIFPSVKRTIRVEPDRQGASHLHHQVYSIGRRLAQIVAPQPVAQTIELNVDRARFRSVLGESA